MKNNSSIKRIGVLTSGGDAPGMNAAIRAVVRGSVFHGVEVDGIFQGYAGLISGDFKRLNERSVARILGRGGTILKSSRCVDFMSTEGRKKAFEQIVKNQVDALIAIGGNGSLTGAHLLYEEFGIPVMGIPGSIDNDLFGTDHCIGFDTATNNVVDAVDKIRDTANSHNRLFFVEVMGRRSGFIALKSGIATGAIAIILPEDEMSVEELVETLQRSESSGKTSSIVIVAEGSKSGGAYARAQAVTKKYTQYETRVSILGHLQRGGAPSCYDRVIASRMGLGAVEGLLEGKKDCMVGIINDKEVYTPLEVSIAKSNFPNRDELRIARVLSI
ncbi:MAG: 6-phosphofructokinase [Crocinitomicaceae bacterium]|nr:6-phosphofructokinase [Crocinitomicaceae bacterium]